MMSCCGKHCREVGLWIGLILFVVGAVILLQMFEVIPDTTWDYLWPSILVIAGLKMIVCSADSCGAGEGCCPPGESCCPKCGMCGTCVCPTETASKPARKKKATKKRVAKKKK